MIISSDFQVHDFKQFAEPTSGEMTTRLQEAVDSIRYLGEYAKSKNEKNILILGDLFEVKGYVKVIVYNLVFNELLRLKRQGFNLYILVGNHDQYDSGGLIHSLVPFKEIARIYETLKIELIEGITCVFIPYRKNKKVLFNDLAEVEKMEIPSNSLLFMHQILEGVTLADQYYASSAGIVIPERVKNKFSKIICGDVHQPQEFDKVIYPGSLFSRNYTDKFEQKSFLRYTDGVIEKIENPYSPLFLKYIIRDTDPLPEIPQAKRIYVDIECDSDSLERVNKHFSGNDHIRYVARPLKKKITTQHRGNVKLAMGTEEIIRNYVAYMQREESLANLGIEIYREAVSKE